MTNPEMGFAITFDSANYEKGSELAKIGWRAWWAATDPDDWHESLFSKEEVASFYDLGFCEPTKILLDRNGIAYEIEECFNESGDYLENFNCQKVSDFI